MAEDHADGLRWGGRQLRLALAMRGGVSLAVWIGGACAEIERCRLSADAATSQDSAFYGPLLRSAGYDDVHVDVLAGASAGGLNGALLSTALVYGVDFSGFRDVWLTVAGLRTLLGPPRSSAGSLLRGDYFLTQLSKQLTTAFDQRSVDRPRAPYVDLHLAATATAARPVAVSDDAAGWFCEGTFRAGFRFRHNPSTSDFVELPDAGGDVAPVLHKLALAARASSSFPGAFAPARVEIAAGGDQIGERAAPSTDSLLGVFTDPSRPGAAWIVDGGVLDNIPVGRAIQSIAEAPAQSATARWLLYLCPSPDDLDPLAHDARPAWPDGAGSPDVLWTLKGVMRAGGSRESILEDMVALREHNTRAAQYEAARELLLATVLAGGADPLEALMQTAGATRKAAAGDAARRAAGRLRALLEDPVAAFGEDPFPPSSSDDGPLSAANLRWPLAATATLWTRARRSRLETALGAELRGQFDAAFGVILYGGVPSAAVGTLGPGPAGRGARYLIGQIGELEREQPSPLDGFGTSKDALYRLADAADLLTHMGELVWPLLWALNPPADADGTPDTAGFTAWAGQRLAERDAFVRAAARQAEELEEALAAAGTGALAATASDLVARFTHLRQELARRLERVDPDASCLEAPDLGQWLWQRLARHTAELAALVSDEDGLTLADDPNDDTAGARSRQAFLAVTAGIAALPEGERDEQALRSLVALDIVSAPLQRISPVPLRAISFVRVSGASGTDLPFDALRDDGALPVRNKLCGNAVANFAAFYRRAWRANDWMWGRLDAVDGLLQVLLDPETLLRRLPTDADAADFVEAVRAIVTAPFAPVDTTGPTPGDWAGYFDQLWSVAGVEEEVQALRDGEGSELLATKCLLCTRRQWEIVAADLPVVEQAKRLDDDETATMSRGFRAWTARKPMFASGYEPAVPEPLPTPAVPSLAALTAEVSTYAVGKEQLTDDVGGDHLTRIVADTTIAAWGAALNTGRVPGLVRRPLNLTLPMLHWLLMNSRRARRWVRIGPAAPGD